MGWVSEHFGDTQMNIYVFWGCWRDFFLIELILLLDLLHVSARLMCGHQRKPTHVDCTGWRKDINVCVCLKIHCHLNHFIGANDEVYQVLAFCNVIIMFFPTQKKVNEIGVHRQLNFLTWWINLCYIYWYLFYSVCNQLLYSENKITIKLI